MAAEEPEVPLACPRCFWIVTNGTGGMIEDDVETPRQWERLADKFGRLRDRAPRLCLHAEHSGEHRKERKTELQQSSPAVRLIDGNGGWLWWLDGENESVAEFLTLAKAAGSLLSRTHAILPHGSGPPRFLSRYPGFRGIRDLSSTAEWFRCLLNGTRTAGEAVPTRRGRFFSDAVGVSRRGCDRILRGPDAWENDRSFARNKFRGSWPAGGLVGPDETLANRFPKAPPGSSTALQSAPFAVFAEELWRCWESVLFRAEARLWDLGEDSRTAWLRDTYWLELAGCLERIWKLLPLDGDDSVDGSSVQSQALRDLNQLMDRLWSICVAADNMNRVCILPEVDEARFGEMVATFDRIRSQITPPTPIAGNGAAEANSNPPKPVNAQADVLPGGDDIGSGTGGKPPGKAGAASNPNEPAGDEPKPQRCQKLAYFASRYAEWKLEQKLTA